MLNPEGTVYPGIFCRLSLAIAGIQPRYRSTLRSTPSYKTLLCTILRLSPAPADSVLPCNTPCALHK